MADTHTKKYPLPITPDNIHDDLKAIIKLLQSWEVKLDKAHFPGWDVPAPDQDVVAYLTNMANEFIYAGRRLELLGETIAGGS